MGKYFVRKAKLSDIESLKKIYSDSFEIQISDDINHIKNNIYVVDNDFEVIGMCIVDYIDDIFISKRIAFINGVCVHKKYRNQGVATFMLLEIEKIALEDGCIEIMLTSASNRKAANYLYNKLGFSIYDTNVFKKKIL